MKVVKQFVDVADGVCRLTSDEDKFVPEMSLPIKDILSQFAYVDNIRLADMAKRGYDVATDDEDDFDVVDMDQMDLAEREEVMDDANEVINQAKRKSRSDTPQDTPEETPQD